MRLTYLCIMCRHAHAYTTNKISICGTEITLPTDWPLTAKQGQASPTTEPGEIGGAGGGRGRGRRMDIHLGMM